MNFKLKFSKKLIKSENTFLISFEIFGLVFEITFNIYKKRG